MDTAHPYHPSSKSTKPFLRYYLDFLLLPASIVGLTFYTRASWSWGWLAFAGFGVVLFTFVEYWVHRSLLHRIFWSAYHQRHHEHPAEFVLFPWWYMPLVFTLIFFFLSLVSLPVSMFVGFQIGAMWFFCWHHVLHHWNLQKHPWLLVYSCWHDLHHKDLPFNYGITHPLWDVVFGTYCSTKDGRVLLIKRALSRGLKLKNQA